MTPEQSDNQKRLMADPAFAGQVASAHIKGMTAFGVATIRGCFFLNVAVVLAMFMEMKAPIMAMFYPAIGAFFAVCCAFFAWWYQRDCLCAIRFGINTRADWIDDVVLWVAFAFGAASLVCFFAGICQIAEMT